MSFLKKYVGPSTLVTAAFIGPGTLTVCTISGAKSGYSLLWVLVFATLITIFLQEMAARLGLITKKGLGESIRSQVTHPFVKIMAIILVFIAIIIGNAAYEAGNISGAVLGISEIFGKHIPWALIIGGIAFVILFIGRNRLLEGILVVLVILMSAIFLLTAIVVSPDISAIIKGMLTPNLAEENSLAILALIGTTIVPYNLFLHASAVARKKDSHTKLKELRTENAISIGLGGIISIAIVITSAATLFGKDISGISEMAYQLEPLLGSWSKYFLALGLFLAGISSAITAPLAAAYVAQGIFGWTSDLKNWKFRLVWISILLIGIIFSMIGFKPIQVIQLAQIANGILLPIIVFFLIYICNKRVLLNEYVNKWWQNILAILLILVSIALSFKSLNSVFKFIEL